MAKRTRLQKPRRERQRYPVIRSMKLGKPGWSLPQAAALLSQGYTPEQAEYLTGFSKNIIRSYSMES